MLTKLDSVILKNGRTLEILRLLPPDDSELVEKLKVFYSSYNELSRRSIYDRLDGCYIDQSNDYYFVALIDGEIAGCLCFGLGKHANAAANFGNVYVPEKFRGLGITNILMPYFKADFDRSGASAAFCTCSREWIVKMYRKVGFEQIRENSPRLMLAGDTENRHFPEFSAAYFNYSAPFRVINGSFDYRHEIDCIAMFSGEFTKRSFLSSSISSCQQALFMQQDGKAELLYILDSNDHLAGWCFTTAANDNFRIFDFSCHRDIPKKEIQLALQEVISKFAGTLPLVSASFENDEYKSALLSGCGFERCGKFPGEFLWQKII